MAVRLITCPETAHLETIQHDPSPLGMLIVACTRFRPACTLDCARRCAALMDRRDRQPPPDDDPQTSVRLLAG